MKNSLHFLQF